MVRNLPAFAKKGRFATMSEVKEEVPERPARQLEPARKTSERFGVCPKTLDAWVRDGILQPPTRIKGRKYYDTDVEPA
jgi:MerR HTH family regulatory protein